MLKINMGVKTYSLTAVGPEIVWDFGKPIPVIEEGEKSLLPSEKNFGLLVDVKDSASIEQNSLITRLKIYRINVNYKKGLKERLASYYLFRKPINKSKLNRDACFLVS